MNAVKLADDLIDALVAGVRGQAESQGLEPPGGAFDYIRRNFLVQLQPVITAEAERQRLELAKLQEEIDRLKGCLAAPPAPVTLNNSLDRIALAIERLDRALLNPGGDQDGLLYQLVERYRR